MRRRRAPARLLLVSDGPVDGLANCLELLDPALDIERCDAPRANERLDALAAGRDGVDHVVLTLQARDRIDPGLAASPALLWLPPVRFSGYHPDVACVAAGDPLANGPTGGYHSLIAWAAFANGLDEAAAIDCFRAETYLALGYLEAWMPARAQLVGDFAAHGFDLGGLLAGWSRRGPFMHTPDRPKIFVFRDIARLLLARLGRAACHSDLLPHDDLASGPMHPVFPEIGTRLGLAGSADFKFAGSYRPRSLQEFVAGSFATYREAGAGALAHPALPPAVVKAVALVADGGPGAGPGLPA